MSEQAPLAPIVVGLRKQARGYLVTHPKGMTYFLSSLGVIKNTYGVSEDQLKDMGWSIQALED